jgi:uncharacterized coiled-coil protein SlyX
MKRDDKSDHWVVINQHEERIERLEAKMALVEQTLYYLRDTATTGKSWKRMQELIKVLEVIKGGSLEEV